MLQVAFDASEALCGLPDTSGCIPANFPADYFEFLQVRCCPRKDQDLTGSL